MNKENLVYQAESRLGHKTWEITRNNIHPEIEGRENFAIGREHLENGGSILVYADDPSDKTGIPLMGIAIEEELTSIDHLGLFVSRSQVDWRQGWHFPNLAQHLLLESFWGKDPGVTVFRVVQEKHRKKYKKWAEDNDAAYNQAGVFLNTAGNVFAITPGATRSDALIFAQPGAAALFRSAREIALAMPIAIPKGTPRVIAGRPFSWKESQEDYQRNPNMRTKDRMMVRLAVLFPEDQRGDYTQMTEDFVWPPAANS